MGDSQVISSVGSGKKPVENDPHKKKTGGGGTVGGTVTNFLGMYKGERI